MSNRVDDIDINIYEMCLRIIEFRIRSEKVQILLEDILNRFSLPKISYKYCVLILKIKVTVSDVCLIYKDS